MPEKSAQFSTISKSHHFHIDEKFMKIFCKTMCHYNRHQVKHFHHQKTRSHLTSKIFVRSLHQFLWKQHRRCQGNHQPSWIQIHPAKSEFKKNLSSQLGDKVSTRDQTPECLVSASDYFLDWVFLLSTMDMFGTVFSWTKEISYLRG